MKEVSPYSRIRGEIPDNGREGHFTLLYGVKPEAKRWGERQEDTVTQGEKEEKEEIFFGDI
jgi:hypothetical protein